MTPTDDSGSRQPGHGGLSAREGAERLDLDPGQVWTEYLALGGTLPQRDIFDALAGTHRLPPKEYAVLAAALNEHFVEIGEDHAVASDEAAPEDAASG